MTVWHFVIERCWKKKEQLPEGVDEGKKVKIEIRSKRTILR
jgi:hypothetical protein